MPQTSKERCGKVYEKLETNEAQALTLILSHSERYMATSMPMHTFDSACTKFNLSKETVLKKLTEEGLIKCNDFEIQLTDTALTVKEKKCEDCNGDRMELLRLLDVRQAINMGLDQEGIRL